MMAIPDIPHVAEFLSDLSLFKPADERYSAAELIGHGFARAQTGTFAEQSRSLWYRPVGDFTFDSMTRRLCVALSEQHHPATPSLARILLGLFLLHPKRRSEPIKSINAVLAAVSRAELTQYSIFPFPSLPGTSSFSFGSFTIGAANGARINQRSTEAGSDYFQRWGATLEGRYTIERSRHRCHVLDVLSYEELVEAGPGSHDLRLLQQLCNAYFSLLSAAYFESFWEALDEQQAIQVCLEGTFLPTRELRQFPGMEMVSIYEHIAGRARGWVAPAALAIPAIDFNKADQRIPAVVERLRKDFGFVDYGKNEFDRRIQLFARYVFRGRQRFFDEEYSDSFLQHVIAIDLVFGERRESVDSVSRRTAIVTYGILSSDPQTAKKKVESLYNLRSRYVHDGFEIQQRDVTEIETITREILCCMLRVRKFDPSYADDGYVDKWLRRLDFFWSAVEADQPVSEHDLVMAGVIGTNDGASA